MLDLLKGLGSWSAFYGALFVPLVGFFALLGKSEKSRDRVIDWLNTDKFANKYRSVLTSALDWLDEKLSAREIALNTPVGAPLRAWSLGLLSILLVLALAYPLLSVFGQWVVFGEGRVGAAYVLPPESDDIARWSQGLPVLAFWGAFLYARAKWSGPLRFVIQLVAAGLLLAFAGAVEVAFAVISAFAFAVIGAFLFAVGVTGAFVVAFAVGAAGISVFGAGAFVVAGVVAAFSDHAQRPFLPLMTFAIVGLAAVAVVILLTADITPLGDGAETSASSLVLFFSVLPLINAMFDFLSVGLTRYWLRKGLSGNIVWNGLCDAAAGLAIFLALGCTIIAFIHYVRPQDGVPLIDLKPLFDDLQENPGNYWWLFFMMFSTVVPTLAHAAIALFAVFTLMGPRLRKWLARLFRMGGDGDAHPEWIARTVLSALIAAAIWVPCVVVVEGLARFPELVNLLVGVFRGFAELIGAIPKGTSV